MLVLDKKVGWRRKRRIKRKTKRGRRIKKREAGASGEGATLGRTEPALGEK